MVKSIDNDKAYKETENILCDAIDAQIHLLVQIRTNVPKQSEGGSIGLLSKNYIKITKYLNRLNLVSCKALYKYNIVCQLLVSNILYRNLQITGPLSFDC